MNSLKNSILQYVKNKYPNEVAGVEIEDLSRDKGYSAENGRRRLRELTGVEPHKLIEAISKTILKAGNKRIRVTNYRYKDFNNFGFKDSATSAPMNEIEKQQGGFPPAFNPKPIDTKQIKLF